MQAAQRRQAEELPGLRLHVNKADKNESHHNQDESHQGRVVFASACAEEGLPGHLLGPLTRPVAGANGWVEKGLKEKVRRERIEEINPEEEEKASGANRMQGKGKWPAASSSWCHQCRRTRGGF